MDVGMGRVTCSDTVSCPERAQVATLSLLLLSLQQFLEVSGLMLTALINTENQINEYNICYCVRVANFFC